MRPSRYIIYHLNNIPGLNETIQAIPANSWLEVPNSQLSQVQATDPELDDIWQGNYHNANGLFPWSGGTFDTKRNRLIIWGGGHHDYYGNEIYTFDLTTFTWERITEPSVPTSNEANCMAVLSDGRPNSRHTYHNLAYITSLDRFYSTPAGSTSCGTGGLDPNTWIFDFDETDEAARWVNMNPTGEPVIGWAPTTSAYDPIDDKVYSISPEGLYVHDIQTNHWQLLNGTGFWYPYGAAVDTKRHLLVFIGSGRVIVYDIGNENYEPQVTHRAS